MFQLLGVQIYHLHHLLQGNPLLLAVPLLVHPPLVQGLLLEKEQCAKWYRLQHRFKALADTDTPTPSEGRPQAPPTGHSMPRPLQCCSSLWGGGWGWKVCPHWNMNSPRLGTACKVFTMYAEHLGPLPDHRKCSINILWRNKLIIINMSASLIITRSQKRSSCDLLLKIDIKFHVTILSNSILMFCCKE